MMTSPPPLPSPIAFIGGGNMGRALITGILASSATPPKIVVSSPRPSKLSSLPLPDANKLSSNVEAATGAAMVFLCVKPHVAAGVLRELAPAFRGAAPPVLVSVVAGLSTSGLEAGLGVSPAPPVVRSMPNVAAGAGAGVTGVCAGAGARGRDVEAAEAVLRAVGEVVRVPERLFAAVSAVSGAGVAYVFLVAEALADAGVKQGLGREVAERLAAGAVFGAGKVLLGGEHPAVLRNSVESPGGVTICGTAELERQGVRAAFIDAVEQAVKKAQSMGDA